ncbi:MAG: antibiotic biosynthesis monooxygenase family protein [Actinomycetota bacterium]
MLVVIARFPAVPADKDEEFRDWFTWSTALLRDTVTGLRERRLLRGDDGSYAAVVELEDSSTLTAMHSSEAAAQIHERLAEILDEGPRATRYEVVAQLAAPRSCCGGHRHAVAADA